MKLDLLLLNKLYFVFILAALMYSFINWLLNVTSIVSSLLIVYIVLISWSAIILFGIFRKYQWGLYQSVAFCLVIGVIFIFNTTILKFVVQMLTTGSLSSLDLSINEVFTFLFGIISVLLSFYLKKSMTV